MDRKRYIILILILGTLSALSPFSIDMYLPAFQAIAKDLGTSVEHIQLSLTSYFIGISLGQLLYGPLLDRFGRKKPLFIGLLIYIVASLGCAVTKSANMLIFMRLLQALGSCAGMVAARALVRDLFPVGDIAKVFSLLLLVVALSPMVAPTVGGYISAWFGWHWVFIILTTIAAFIFAGCIYWLPNGREPDKLLSLKPIPIVINFYSVFKQPQFYVYAITGGIASASQYAYLSGSSNVFIGFYHVSQKQFGWIFAFIAAGLIGSSQVNSVLLRSFKSEQVIKVALFIQCLVGLALFTVTFEGWIDKTGMILLIFTFLCCQGFISPNASALSLTPFAKQAGSASALMGFLQMGIGSVASAMVSILSSAYNGSSLPMTGIMAVCPLLGTALLFTGSRIIKKQFIPASAGPLIHLE
ncbi:DHA1 family bicyclomycin/chloramphenicol resistance-like MFS transporter [Mucilaginibacter gracilis]|uniref:DHA1 family bicyclomycin/chloramphenicol resistance-like MFS transporter n=1 Tax=Mucilaginibacter gracilis TaxID=423350 RepID=A0A495J8U9_9SPHI|nr:multidrug effflux MFS transporter [Mucilaginibacter gracilis]RKR85425.1 DHA1 family bicyclomycin/chloramphenicol resistance-like MFS transporter [Mucilaginibacter gracilis]